MLRKGRDLLKYISTQSKINWKFFRLNLKLDKFNKRFPGGLSLPGNAISKEKQQVAGAGFGGPL